MESIATFIILWHYEEERMNKCPLCGEWFDLGNDWRYCPYCGIDLIKLEM